MRRLVDYLFEKHLDLTLSVITALLFLTVVISRIFDWSYAVNLIPVAVTITAAIMLVVWPVAAKIKLYGSATVLIGGFIIGLTSVKTDILGAVNSYGLTAGLRLWGVPLGLLVLALVIIISAWQIVSLGKLSKFYKFVVAGFISLLCFFLLEQLAAGYGLWNWSGGQAAPMPSYAIWLVLAELVFWLFNRLEKLKPTSIYVAMVLPVLAIFLWLMLALG